MSFKQIQRQDTILKHYEHFLNRPAKHEATHFHIEIQINPFTTQKTLSRPIRSKQEARNK